MEVLYLLWCLAILVNGAQAGVTPICSVATNPPKYDIPDFTSQSYFSYISGKIIDQQSTTWGYEVFDSATKKQVISFNYRGLNTKTIYDLARNTAVQIMGNQCQTVDMKGTGVTNNGQRVNIKSALDIAGNSVYMGNSTIRGIPVEQWQFCQSQDGGNISFINDVYLSTRMWLLPSGMLPPVPVRIHIYGNALKPDGGVRTFEHIYDFIHFEKFTGNPYGRLFELPKDMVCDTVPSIEQKDWPKISPSVSFNLQVQQNGRIDESSVFYDTDDQLSREDFFVSKKMYNTPVTTFNTKIRDFRTGILYAIDWFTGQCNQYAFNHVFDPSQRDYLYLNDYQNGTDGYTHMSTVQHMFGMEGKFSYGGQVNVRGVLCNAFYKRIKNYAGVPGDTILGFYFAVNVTTYNTLGRGTAVYNQLMARTVNNQLGFKQESIYNYDAEPMPLTNPFDVRNCFDESDKVAFLMTFERQQLKAEMRTAFSKAVRSQIMTLTDISPVRLHWDDVTFVKGVPTLRGVLLERSDIFKSYAKAPGKVVNVEGLPKSSIRKDPIKITSASYHNLIMTPELCSRICSEERNTEIPRGLKSSNCQSFDLCDGGSSCTFYVGSGYYMYNRPTFLKPSSSCDHYQKLVRYRRGPSLKTAWKSLRDGVYGGKISFLLNDTDSGSTMKFTANAVTDLSQDLDSIGTSDSALNSYIPAQGIELTDGQTIANKDLSGCASSCTGSTGFRCEAFTFCEKVGKCLISARRPTKYSRNNSPSCITYSRTYVKDFIKISGMTALSKTDAVYQAVETEEDCAKFCINYSAFQCESFEFCTDGGGTCLIGKTHYYQTPTTDLKAKATCTHYSRNYLDDFNITKTSPTSQGLFKQIQGLVLAQCARRCVVLQGSKCVGYFFSSSAGGTCQIPDPNGMKYSTTGFDYYKRKSSVQYNQYSDSVYAASGQSDGTTYSGGTMAGLAIGVVLLGAILGVLTVFLIGKLRNRPGNNANVVMSFTPGEDTDT